MTNKTAYIDYDCFKKTGVQLIQSSLGGLGVIFLKNSLQQTPNHLPSKILMGKTLFSKGLAKEALIEFNESLAMGADNNLVIAELAKVAGVGDSYFSRILRLSFLAPDIVKTILDNDHPVDLTARRLSRDTHLPITWNEQHIWLRLK